MRRGVPLHRRAGVVAAPIAAAPAAASGPRLRVVVERLDVAELVDRGEREVRHPELLALVDVRRPAVQVQDGAEHLGRLGAAVAEARHHPRLVVVVPVEAVPAALGQPVLPAAERALEVAQLAAGGTSHLRAPWSSWTCSNWNTMSTSPRAGSVNSFASSSVTPGISPTVSSAVAARRTPRGASPAGTRGCAARRCSSGEPSPPGRVGQRGVLGDHVDDVHAEAVDPAVEPPAHHRVDRLPDLRVLPVEVGLLAREQVQVVLAGRLVELPRRAGEERAPVGRLGRATSTSRASGCRGSSATRRTTGARRRCG